MAVPLIQLALDSLDFNATLELAEKTADHIDIFEIGTPCIKHNGVELVKELRARFPKKLILVDLKTMDAGEYEAEPFFAAGADICTVLGVSGEATIAGVIKAANKYNAEVQVDLINVPNKAECALVAARLGAQIIGVHTGLDAQAAGQTPFGDLQEIADLGLDVRISVAGGIKPETVNQVVETGADIIVVGAAIYGAPCPTMAAKHISHLAAGVGSHQQMVINKIRGVLDSTEGSYEEQLTAMLDGANRIFVSGAGRSGLIARFFAMRLMHSGYKVFLVGEIVTPSIAAGDLLIVISGSGETKQLISFAEKARDVGAKSLLISAKAGSTISELAEANFVIGSPEQYSTVKGMPMGTVFELSTLTFLEGLVSHLIHEKGIEEEEMRSRHANLE